MNRQTESLWQIDLFKIVVTLLVVLFALLAAVSVSGPDKKIGAHREMQHEMFRMQGFEQTIFNRSGKPAFRISADKLNLGSRKIGVFTLRPLIESTIINAKANAYINVDVDGQTDGLLFAQAVQSLHNSALTKVAAKQGKTRIRGIDLYIHHNGKPSLRVTARGSTVDWSRPDIIFSRAVLEDLATGRRIQSRRMQWNQAKERFEIVGAYAAESRKGTAEGRGLAIDLAYNLFAI